MAFNTHDVYYIYYIRAAREVTCYTSSE